MKKVLVTGFCATIGSGSLVLSEAQSAPRLNNGSIVPGKKDGVFDIVNIVTFKRGEVFGYDGELPPSLLEDMAPMKDAVAKEAEQFAAEKAARDARILELDSMGESLTEDQMAELANLLSE
jgi:hypothetical protein